MQPLYHLFQLCFSKLIQGDLFEVIEDIHEFFSRSPSGRDYRQRESSVECWKITFGTNLEFYFKVAFVGSHMGVGILLKT